MGWMVNYNYYVDEILQNAPPAMNLPETKRVNVLKEEEELEEEEGYENLPPPPLVTMFSVFDQVKDDGIGLGGSMGYSNLEMEAPSLNYAGQSDDFDRGVYK